MFWSVGARQLVSLFQLASDGRSIFIYLHLVPALLQEVCAVVVTAVSITESYMADIVVWLVEAVFYHAWERGMPACDHINEHRLTCAIPAHDSDMLTLVEGKVHWLRHRPFGLLRHSIL